ncbi:MAG: putative transporter, permease protein [Actinomycetia bacterium]|nr:putative transporter, permease protein [Actinomycetes bacterium]
MAAPAVTITPARRRISLPPWFGSVIGVVVLLVAWQIAGWIGVFHDTVPPPTRIVQQMFDDGWSFYSTNISTTMYEAAWGYFWGNLLAVGLALVVIVIPFSERPLMQLGIASYCVPIIAIGPILQITFDGPTPKIILSAMSVFFITLIGTLVGLRSADKTSLDVIRAYGGGRVRELTKVRLRAMLPSLFASLRIAAPAAILGAIIGEYLGGDSGLGVAMINSEQALEISRTWAIALIATALAGLAYALTALVGRMLTPWAPRRRA